MTEFAKSRRKPKTKRERNEIVLYFREPSKEEGPSVERFGSSKDDPFGSYPIELDNAARTLIPYRACITGRIKSRSDPNYSLVDAKTFHANKLRDCWYPVGLSSPAAFYVILANAQNFVYHRMHGGFPSCDNAPALKYYHNALRSASMMMDDPSNHMSDEMIGAIASFMGYLVSTPHRMRLLCLVMMDS
jgi:hypothetical protein